MTLPFDDRGFTLGDGLFETVLAEGGQLALWDAHVSRLIRGCATLGLPAPDPSVLRREALASLSREGLAQGRAAVRLSWTAGSGGRGLERPENPTPRLAVQVSPAPILTKPARLVTASVRRNDSSPTSRLKTLSYLDQVLARREAVLAGADDALMLNTRGEVACASAANIFWMAGGALHTPALECGVLDGVVRGRILAAAPVLVIEARATLDALYAAEAVFLTNSLIGVRAVMSLDGRRFDEDPVISEVRAAIS